jgi:hypothetical protein
VSLQTLKAAQGETRRGREPLADNIHTIFIFTIIFFSLNHLTMKRYLLFCAAILCFTRLHAQDIITLRNGAQVKAKVIKVDSFYVAYKNSVGVDTSISVFPRKKVLLINFADGTSTVFRKKYTKEHFLFMGINENFLTVKNNGAGYGISLGGGSYSESITSQSLGTPGLQVNYISYHELSPAVSFFNGEGLIYYHNKFTDIISNSSYSYFYPPYNGNGYGTDSTITNVNSLALFFHYIVGFRFNLDNNLYVSAALEPHIILLYNTLPLAYYTQTSYDSLGQVSSKSSGTIANSNTSTISALNINATIGIGYRLNASTPHPLCIEFDFSPNIFNSPLYFINTANNNESGINIMTFHRFTFELSLGYKF